MNHASNLKRIYNYILNLYFYSLYRKKEQRMRILVDYFDTCYFGEKIIITILNLEKCLR